MVYFLHVEGDNNIIIGIISRRPNSITSDNKAVEKFENPEKLPIGPTTLKPGPTLLMQVSAAVMFVSKSNPSTEIAITDMTMITK